jgi:hypothetical protein
MLQIIAFLLEWLPKLALWILVPAALVLLALTYFSPMRRHCLLGFITVAMMSALFLAIGLVAIFVSYGGSIFRVFHDFGLIETADLLASLLPAIGAQLASLLPALLVTGGAGAAVAVLRGIQRRAAGTSVAGAA